MRKLILQEFVSLDGYAADAGGTTAFFESLGGEAGSSPDKDLLQFIGTIDTILLGANTYRMFAEFWPTATTDEELVADALNGTPKVVFSSSLNDAPWGKWEPARVVKTDATETIRAMKEQSGREMVVWGSLSLAQSLLKDGVIDEIQLWVVPKVLGSGVNLFTQGQDLKLLDTKTYDDGVLLLRYEPA